MNILFYIEPVVFRGDSSWLTGHINNVRCLINANWQSDVTFGLATSASLLREYDNWAAFGGHLDIKKFSLSSRALIEPFDFDRFGYSRDLYDSQSMANNYLIDKLASIEAEFNPDVVISVCENSYLHKAFPLAEVAFHEVGPLPRRDGRNNFFFDFGGHGRNSILAKRTNDIFNLPVSDHDAIYAATKFRTLFKNQQGFSESVKLFGDWIDVERRGRNIALLALQPSDNISIEGTVPFLPTDTFIMKILSNLSDDWVLVPTYHPQMQETSAFDYLAREFPNLLLLPKELRSMGSDPFLSKSDAVITVNSKSALSGALFGKKIVAVGQSLLSGIAANDVALLDTSQQLNDIQVGKILVFLSNRYTLSFEECFEQQGFFLNFLTGALNAESGESFQVSSESWERDKLKRIFGTLL